MPWRGDDVLDAGHEAGDEIELAFADDGDLGVEHGAFGFVEAEEDVALGEDGGFGGVDVLGGLGFGIKDVAAEADNAALSLPEEVPVRRNALN